MHDRYLSELLPVDTGRLRSRPVNCCMHELERVTIPRARHRMHGMLDHARARELMYLSPKADSYRPLPSMGMHGYMYELLTQHVVQYHSFFLLQQ